MCSCRHFYFRAAHLSKRCYASKPKTILIELQEELANKLTIESIKPKEHPGRINCKNVKLPSVVINSIKVAMADSPFKTVKEDSKSLVNYLWSRHPPLEEWQISDKRASINTNLMKSTKYKDMNSKTSEEITNLDKKRERTVNNIMRKTMYHWEPVTYDKYTCLKYLVSRAAPEYAVLCKLFKEIKMKDEKFKPVTFFDFGSGIGTGLWAVNSTWENIVDEYFSVDSSPEMNDLARLITCKGVPDAEAPVKKYFQRQFLPSAQLKYDLVLSAYSLFELPSAQNRLQTILNLWRRTKKYLVIVEPGTNAGYNLVTEARDFILEMKDDSQEGHVLAPCPHDTTCPRFFSDNTPCNFMTDFVALDFTPKTEFMKEVYSYVILRKGKRQEGEDSWPRIVRPTLLRSKHVICRMCCDDGKLKEIIFTAKKHGKLAYRCAKASGWGDSLPIKITHLQVPEEDLK